MKINLTKENKDRTLLSHIVLHCATTSLIKSIVKEREDKGLEENIVDLTLTCNGKEIDIQKFMKHWQSLVEVMIREEAKDRVESFMTDKLNDIHDVMEDLESRLKEEVDKRMEDWEKEEEN